MSTKSLTAFFMSLCLIMPVMADVYEYRLENGMKVVVKPDHRAPVVISQIWYRVGSADEHSGITGISHVLEHMMFKGTQRYPAGRFSSIIAEHGGRENAFTSLDYTGYYQMLEKDRMEVSFELEADRMHNLTLPADAFKKELEVVKEERRLRTDDNPQALSYEQLFATAFNNSPYRNPVIGWMGDLGNLKVEDLQRWYSSWYAPNNATLVVVGDVDPSEILRLAKKHYGPIPARELPAENLRKEPPQRGVRRAKVKAPAELPYVVLGFKTPVLGQSDNQWEVYALEVLSGVLDGGRSARLSKHLVRERELAASAGAQYSLYGRYPGLFTVDGIPAQGYTLAELEQALNNEIDTLRDELVSEDELRRVKAQVVAAEIFARDSVSRQASLIGSVESIGLGWKVLDEYTPRIQAVTAEQLREVARKYLVEDRKTVVVLEPLPIETPELSVIGGRQVEGQT